jgi:hypothetical protein
MATTQEINDFKATVMSVNTQVGNAFTNALSISGRSENEVYFKKFRSINIYTNILLDYFNETSYGQYNFFTTDEIYEIIEHFNDLSNTDYTINL